MASGPTSSGSTLPRPPPSIIAGPPMPSELFSVATIRSEQPAITALPAKHLPATTAMRGTTPDRRAHSANARVSSAETAGWSVSPGRPPPPSAQKTVGTHPLDELEQAVLLAVAERALRPGAHRVVVGEHGAGGALAEPLAADASGPGDEPVRGRARDEVLDVAAPA